MATLTTGVTLSDGDTVTSQTLHNMIEDATISNIAASDVSGGELCQVQSDAPDPDNGHFWWDTNYVTGQVLRVYAAPWNCWIAVGPDRFSIPMINGQGQTLRKGALVYCSAASTIAAGTGVTLNAVGFTQDTAASGAAVEVAVLGYAFVSYGTAVSTASNVNRAALKGEAFTSVGMPAGQVGMYGPAQALISGGDNANHIIHGVFLEQVESSNEETLRRRGYRAFLFGPKLANWEP